MLLVPPTVQAEVADGRLVTTLAAPLTICGSRFMRSPGVMLQSKNQPSFWLRSTPLLVSAKLMLLPLPTWLSVCCTMLAPRTLMVAPLSFNRNRLWTSVLVVSGTSSRRPLPNSTTHWAVVALLVTPPSVLVVVIAHSVTSGRVVIGLLVPASPILTTGTLAPVVSVRSKRHMRPLLSPP